MFTQIYIHYTYINILINISITTKPHIVKNNVLKKVVVKFYSIP